ncbi:uncharacterized protein [Taeniopygia guttata]|uniref:uncharacterized protein isoform X2 n=1 Tax=Taeniopygia guttata TaxID=59729 RepID=UPI003BB93ED4
MRTSVFILFVEPICQWDRTIYYPLEQWEDLGVHKGPERRVWMWPGPGSWSGVAALPKKSEGEANCGDWRYWSSLGTEQIHPCVSTGKDTNPQ